MWSLFLLLGIVVGATGTLVGAGGGFLLVPVLLHMSPESSGSQIAALSMLVVVFNAASGSFAYARKKQIHWASALLFSAAAGPGVWLGIRLGHQVTRASFELVFGVFLSLMAIYIFIRSRRYKRRPEPEKIEFNKKTAALGTVISFGVGVFASFLGIGGGIIHVPLLSELLGFPVHLATGTSHMILALTAGLAVYDHWQSGIYSPLADFAPMLILGVVIGAQIGARHSKRVSSERILQILSMALLIVGLRLVARALGSIG